MTLNNSLKIIGITGEAGAGKTTIVKKYAALHNGYYILTDDVAKAIMEPGMCCYDKVVEHFGNDILAEDKSINRSKLASIVFDNEDELKILNSLVHSEVVAKVTDIINNIKSLNNESNCGKIYKVVLIESAIIFQVEELVDLCDEIWYVEATKDDRKDRLKRERNYSDERIEAMSISQESVRLTKDKCDRVIINERDIDELNELLLNMKL
jgi:dephospho-CoA kinase